MSNDAKYLAELFAKSDKHLHALEGDTPEGVVAVTNDGQYILKAKTTKELFELSPEEVENLDLIDPSRTI